MIPRIIHIFETKHYAKKRAELWQLHNPDYMVILWDKNKVNSRKWKTQTLIEKFPGLKNDILRCELLYALGGFSFDPELEAHKPIGDNRDTDLVAAFQSQNVISTHALGTIPGHPVTTRFLDTLPDNIAALTPGASHQDSRQKIYQNVLELYMASRKSKYLWPHVLHNFPHPDNIAGFLHE